MCDTITIMGFSNHRLDHGTLGGFGVLLDRTEAVMHLLILSKGPSVDDKKTEPVCSLRKVGVEHYCYLKLQYSQRSSQEVHTTERGLSLSATTPISQKCLVSTWLWCCCIYCLGSETKKELYVQVLDLPFLQKRPKLL
ncbi:uncharacterized protein LOC113276109 isoform X2 [Papaver somniferum]|uniref:uncharacterized protein LOC113276109 isoform X2 n=1 Tax=Papaver somniferum TaxID=3469 RepID=UPI000E6F9710|nr:uncharacterized protein LOC113276109 isoform X2 [Papaver somniferum]